MEKINIFLDDANHALYQWDTGQKIMLFGVSAGARVDWVQGTTLLTVEAYESGGKVYADVPNILLQTSGSIKALVYVIDDNARETVYEKPMTVRSREKPSEYAYTETEVKSWEDLSDRVAALEENSIAQEDIGEAVEKYLSENPVVTEETDPTVPDWAKQPEKPAYTAEEVGALAADNPVGTGALSINRKADTTVGDYSTAAGYEVEASGRAAHAEGLSTHATGVASHAEGWGTHAVGTQAHAEGWKSEANGAYSHAEGMLSTADGISAHAENRSKAQGQYSHSEGLGTVAASPYSHVQGSYNVPDDEIRYQHIVGNGTTDEARHNMHTLDWSGNAWFSGDVYVGGDSQDEGSEKLAKASEIPDIPDTLPNPNALTFTGAVEATYDGSEAVTVNIPEGGSGGGTDLSLGLESATVGQIAKITAVDDSGKPTAWEPVDLPSGSGEWKLHKELKLEEDVVCWEIDLPTKWTRLYLLTTRGENVICRDPETDTQKTYCITAATIDHLFCDSRSHYVYMNKDQVSCVIDRMGDHNFASVFSSYVSSGNCNFTACSQSAKPRSDPNPDFEHIVVHNWGTTSTNVISAGTKIKIMYME